MTQLTREVESADKPYMPFLVSTGIDSEPDKTYKQTFAHQSFTPVWSVSSGRETYSVLKPIKIHIYFVDKVCFAENEALALIGTGNSHMDAVHDLFRHLIYFYKYYKELADDEVTGDAIRLKELYNELFVEQE